MTEKVKEFCAKKVNKAIALMLTLAMVFTMVPALAFPVFAEGNKIIVVDGSTGGYALTAAGVNSAINAAVAGGTVYINGMVDVDNIIIVNKSITISGDSGSILLRKNTYAGKMISVSSWADLTIDTITIDGNNVSNSNSVIMTSSNSTLTMNSGCIKNNICFGYGSAINNSGMFIMNGGSILSNKTGYYGSALSNNGTFIMNSGTISDNMANMGGGGVYNINNATINGGTISGNTAKSGGGVYDGGIFKVSGTACVTGNKKSDGTVNNVYITSGKTITLTDNNYSGSVGINMDTTGTAIVADIGVTLTSDHKDQFFIDNMARGSDIYDAVLNNNDNQIEVQKIGGSQIKTAGNLSDLNFAISGAANDTMTYINITDDIPVTSQISISAKNITLYSSTGKSLTRGSSDIILFNVSNSSKFAIRDLTIDGRKDTFTDNTKTLIYNNNSKVILNPGTVLTNNTASYGSAINNYGTLLMNDGSISKNVATGVSGNYGSIYNNGTFTLNGGNISEGTNIGVFNYGSLYMNGGSIIKMASTIVSGGVNNNGTFAMSGGIISGNTAIYGGGVNNNGTFTMSGGIISGNTASSGGGVYNNSTFNIKGASNITDNYNIYPSVNNVEIATDKTMTVTGALNGTIGVTMRTYGTAAKGTVDYKITENDVKCFKSDASGYEVTKVDNSIKIAVPAPKIATQPQSFTKKIGETAKFSVVATNVNTYQWQVNKNDEKGFQNINDATSADYSVVMSADMDGYKYQCVVTGAGGSVTSDTATLNLFTYKVTINAGSGTATYNSTTKNSIDVQVPDGKSLGDMGITFTPLADYVVSGFTDVTIIDSIKTYSSLSEIKPISDMSINVNYKKTPALALAVSTDKPTYSDTLTLTATLSKIANVNNVSLDFYNGETKIGFGTTNDKGVATITYDVTSLDSLNFSVKYAGDDNNTANVATLGQLTVAKKELTVNVSIKDKQYDGLNTAEFNQTPTLVGVASGDTVSLTNVTPTFASVNVEDIININFTDEFTISGTDANNYTLIQPTGITASIYNNYTAVKDTDYTVTTNDWANTAFEIKAKPGYMVSMRDIANSNYWHDQNSNLMFEGETANGKVNFYVKNTATGAISKVVTETFKIDQTKPENVTVSYQDNGWKQFLNAITFGLFFKDTITVKITATDTLSGVKEFKYTIGGAEQTIVATDGSAEFNIQPQYKGN
ncbi:MAG: hypothetical protein DBX47_06805, partial [Clostridiales bacterium]